MKIKLFRSWTSVIVAIALVLTLLPVFPKQASAASTIFYPDDTGMSQKANPTFTNGVVALDRNVAYVANSKTIDIKGTYHSVASDSMVIKVEQMVKDSANKWTTDPQRSFTKGINALPNNRFEASRIQFFAGYNKVTFLGKQNGQERFDVLYVLYDDIPYLKSLKVGTGNSEPVDLNEGVSRVIPKPTTITDPNYKMTVYLQGQADNATKVSVNGNVTTPTEDGVFFAPPITLVPGKNEVEIVVENDTNRVVAKRTIYYYDPLKPYVELGIKQDGAAGNPLESLLTGRPKLTDTTTTAKIVGTIITPYSATNRRDDFRNTATVTAHVYTGTPQAFTGAALDPVTETVIPGDDGDPAYKLITFNLNGYNIPNSADKETKTLDLQIAYGTFTNQMGNLKYDYYPGDVVITEAALVDATGANISPLNNSEVTQPNFFIKVKTNKAPAGVTKLQAMLLPLGTSNLTVTHKPAIVTGTNEYVYEVAGLPNGSQKLRLQYEGSQTGFDATVNYVSKRYIYLEGINDGQTVKVNSKNFSPGVPTSYPKIPISGQFVGFDELQNVELAINGKKVTDLTIPTVKPYNFSYELKFDNSVSEGRLYFGENTIVVSGDDTSGGTIQSIRKVVKIYIVDENMPNLFKFQPLEIPTSGTRPVLDANIFTSALTQFIYKNEKFVTSLKSYDLAFQGNGATEIKLMRGGEMVLHSKISGNTASIEPDSQLGSALFQTSDFNGTSDNFLFRIRNLTFDAPGSHVYTLELKNATGAPIQQRLEIQREVAPYRILSPQPTVGDRIVVNKNFVRFDIEAEGATQVLIDKKPAVKRPDFNDRYILDYSGLKPGKETTIPVSIVRSGGTLNTSVKVFYTNTVEIGSQFMEKIGSKHSVFGGDLLLSFPKGTVMKTADPSFSQNQVTKFYDQTQLMFGIADPANGMVEKMNDYGNRKGLDIDLRTDARTPNGQYAIPILDWLAQQFTSPSTRQHFTAVSPYYWISGGVGEENVKGSANYKPATNGLDPYDVEGTFTTFLPERKVVPTERGTLTLQFDKSVVDIAGSQVTVFHFNDKGEWNNIGGVVDTGKNTITVPFDDYGYYVVMKLREGFADITIHPWARNVLEALFAKGFMKNIRYEDFGTDDFTTRGEFAAMIVKSLNIPLKVDNNNTFVDVVPGSKAVTWDYAHIETAARAGIITGMDNRWFGVNQRLTREQAATMIARALDLKVSINDSKLNAKLEKSFEDVAAMSYYAKPFIDAVNNAGIMVGRPSNLEDPKSKTLLFDPQANLTRAEVGEISVRLLQKYTKIFPKNLN